MSLLTATLNTICSDRNPSPATILSNNTANTINTTAVAAKDNKQTDNSKATIQVTKTKTPTKKQQQRNHQQHIIQLQQYVKTQQSLANPLEIYLPPAILLYKIQHNVNVNTNNNDTSKNTSTSQHTHTEDNTQQQQQSPTLCYLQYKHSNELTTEEQSYIFTLTKTNMSHIYSMSLSNEWKWLDKKKQKELFHENARYILIYIKNNNTNNNHDTHDYIGFIHIRYELEGLDPVLYIYELQISTPFQRYGLGKYLISVIELLCIKMNMQRIMLTVLKHNMDAMKFYKTLGFTMDDTDPSHDDFVDDHATLYDYEIWAKRNKRYKGIE